MQNKKKLYFHAVCNASENAIKLGLEKAFNLSTPHNNYAQK